MFDSIKNIKTMHAKVAALERIDKKFFTANSEYKLETQPRKLYFINKEKQIEILYNSELYGRKALVKTSSFPYMTISLDPTGNLMRKNQHYTINELGYSFIGHSIALTINKDKAGLSNFSYIGKSNRNGYNCYLLEYENKNYNYVDYKTEEKETVSSIAAKLCVNDYLLREKNNLINNFGYLKSGIILKIPNLYCKKAILFIDEKLLLPVSLSIYDDYGLFESYDFTSIQINTIFKPEEFKKENKNYSF